MRVVHPVQSVHALQRLAWTVGCCLSWDPHPVEVVVYAHWSAVLRWTSWKTAVTSTEHTCGGGVVLGRSSTLWVEKASHSCACSCFKSSVIERNPARSSYFPYRVLCLVHGLHWEYLDLDLYDSSKVNPNMAAIGSDLGANMHNVCLSTPGCLHSLLFALSSQGSQRQHASHRCDHPEYLHRLIRNVHGLWAKPCWPMVVNILPGGRHAEASMWWHKVQNSSSLSV